MYILIYVDLYISAMNLVFIHNNNGTNDICNMGTSDLRDTYL